MSAGIDMWNQKGFIDEEMNSGSRNLSEEGGRDQLEEEVISEMNN